MELTPKQIESIRLLYGEENSDDADYIIDLLRKRKRKDILTKTFYYYSDKFKDFDNPFSMKKVNKQNLEKIVEKKLFDKNGNINYTVEEFEQWLNYPFKDIVYKADIEYLEPINQHFQQIKELIRKLKKYDSLEMVSNEIELLSKSVKRRSRRLIDVEIKRIDKSIDYLQQKKQQLEQENSIDIEL